MAQYWPQIRYEYHVNGKHYVADRWRFGGFGGREEQAGMVAGQYAVGRSVTVFFDPENPSEAVLEPGKTGWALDMSADHFIVAAVAVVTMLAVWFYFKPLG